MQGRSPFAHRALVQCLLAVQSDTVHSSPRSPSPGFDFITGPIQRLFKEHPPSVRDVLKVLCVLEIRFRQTYIHVPMMNWNEYFNIDIAFLEDVLASTSAEDLASTLTSTDEGLVSGLSQQTIMSDNAAVRQITTEWHLLSMAVWELCSGLPEYIEYMQECIQVWQLYGASLDDPYS